MFRVFCAQSDGEEKRSRVKNSVKKKKTAKLVVLPLLIYSNCRGNNALFREVSARASKVKPEMTFPSSSCILHQFAMNNGVSNFRMV